MKSAIGHCLTWLVIATVCCSSANSANDEWNKYSNRRLHVAVSYPCTYNQIIDGSIIPQPEGTEAGSPTSQQTWQQRSKMGEVYFQSGGGLAFGIEVYRNDDELGLQEATRRAIERLTSMSACEAAGVDSLWIDGKRALSVDIYCPSSGKKQWHSRFYVSNAYGMILAISFYPEVAAGPLDLIADSEEQIADIVSSFRWTFWLN